MKFAGVFEGADFEFWFYSCFVRVPSVLRLGSQASMFPFLRARRAFRKFFTFSKDPRFKKMTFLYMSENPPLGCLAKRGLEPPCHPLNTRLTLNATLLAVWSKFVGLC